MVIERMKLGGVSQKKPEDHETGLSILDIKPHHDKGIFFHLINHHRIHLTENTICQIIQVSTKNNDE